MADKELEKILLNIFVTSATSTVAKTVTAPIERIKLILQNQDSQIQIVRGERQRYSGLVNCLLRIPKEQGFLSFWRGNGTNLIRYVPSQVLNFFFNDLFKRNLTNYVDGKIILGFVSGALAGAISILAVYPLKYCQTRLSVDTGSLKSTVPREFHGLSDCIGKLIKSHGFLGLYKGFSVAIIGSTLYRALYFGLFDSMNYCHVSYCHVEQVPFSVKFFVAQIVTNFAGFVTYPFDTVGRRIIVESGQPRSLRKLKRPWNASKVIYHNEGFSSFYKGALTNSLKGVCGALVLVFYEEIMCFYAQPQRNSNEFKNFVFNFMVAGSVGAIGKSLTAPMDRIKVILQTQYSSNQILEHKREPYKGILDCIIRIPREQGVLSFWRGNTVNILRYFPTQALNFSLNDYILNKIRHKENFNQNRFVSFISGGMSGAITTLIMYPLEYCQTRISADIGSDKKYVNDKYYIKRQFSGMPDCISKTSRRGGIKAFYCGIGIATVGMTVYRTMYFGLYDLFKTFLALKSNNTDRKMKLLSALFVAQCITVTASTFTYPLDTLGRRLMMEVAKNKDQRRFDNTWGAAKSIFAEGGIRSFYKGIFANYLKGFSGALILVLYDEIITYFS